MDDLIDDLPFSLNGKTTFELIDHYLPILMGDLVNGKLKCGGKLALNQLSQTFESMSQGFGLQVLISQRVARLLALNSRF